MPKIISTKSVAERYTLRTQFSKEDVLTHSWWADIMISQDGFVNIQSDYGDYCYRWDSFGRSIKEFLVDCDYSYLYGKFGRGLSKEFNYNASLKRIQQDILRFRKDTDIDEKDARKYWDIALIMKKLHCSDTTEWYQLLTENEMAVLYHCDLEYAPCVTDDNYQLKIFLKEIWPELIKILKEEINEHPFCGDKPSCPE